MDTTLSEVQWAWLAGLFEGEGSIVLKKESATVQVGIVMTDRDVVATVNSLFPSASGVLQHTGARDRRKQQWGWKLYQRDDVTDFLTGILPWLHGRRSQRAKEALAHVVNSRGYGGPLRKTRCLQGHPLSGDNLYVSPKGHRSCRTCKRLWGKRARESVRNPTSP
jgi:hypothetical protein